MFGRVLLTAALFLSARFVAAEVIEGPADLDRFGITFERLVERFPEPVEGVEVYVAEYGDEFSAQTIADGVFPTFDEWSTEQNVRTRELGLGFPGVGLFSRALYFWEGPLVVGYRLRTTTVEGGGGDWDVYGWSKWDGVQNQVIGQIGIISFWDVVYLDSAAAIGGQGVIVGTARAIPEPSGAALLMAGGVALTPWRRRARVLAGRV